MKVFEFSGAETDWVAAHDETEARTTLMLHYGITADDVAGSYESVAEVDPSSVVFLTDEWDEEHEESRTETAAEMISGRTRAHVVGSTCGY